MYDFDFLHKRIAKNIHGYRLASCLTVEQIGQRATTFTQTELDYWEKGKVRPSIRQLSELSEILGLSLSTLVDTQ